MSVIAYKLRCRTRDVALVHKKVKEWGSTRHIIGFEEDYKKPNNPHVHVYLIPDMKAGTIREQIRAELGMGNGGYAMPRCSGEVLPLKYLAYCIKQGNVIIEGFTDEEIVEIKAYDEKVKEEMKSRPKPRTQLAIIRELVLADYVCTAHEDQVGRSLWLHKETGGLITKKIIVDLVLDYCLENKKLIRRFALISQCQTLCCEFVPSYQLQFRENLLNDI